MIKEKFQALVSACTGDADMLDILDSDMKALSDYVNAVYAMETSIPIILARYEGEEVRDRIQALDQRRRDKHESTDRKGDTDREGDERNCKYRKMNLF